MAEDKEVTIYDIAKRPDAVFSANDTAAVLCMLKLKAAGIKIPEQIAFAGFHNDLISLVIEPNLTTVDYSGYNIGQTAEEKVRGEIIEKYISVKYTVRYLIYANSFPH